MYLPSALEVLSQAHASAVYKDLPDVQTYHRDSLHKLTDAERQECSARQATQGPSAWPGRWEKRRPRFDEVTVYAMFAQGWSSTALGFGGVGGQAASEAYTIVLQGPSGDRAVYFNGALAYVLRTPAEGTAKSRKQEQSFIEDLANRQLADVMTAALRYGAFKGAA